MHLFGIISVVDKSTFSALVSLFTSSILYVGVVYGKKNNVTQCNSVEQ